MIAAVPYAGPSGVAQPASWTPSLPPPRQRAGSVPPSLSVRGGGSVSGTRTNYEVAATNYQTGRLGAAFSVTHTPPMSHTHLDAHLERLTSAYL